MQNSEFDNMLKEARSIGAAQAFDAIRTRVGVDKGDPHAFEKAAGVAKALQWGKDGLGMLGRGAEKAKLWKPGQAAKAPTMSRDGVNIAIPGQAATKGSLTGLGKGVAGTALLGGTGAGAFAGGASYGKDKAVETLGNNFDNMDLMQRLALMWQVITGNKQGAMDRLSGPAPDSLMANEA